MPTKAKPKPPPSPTPIYDAVTVDLTWALADLGEPFDLEATIATSYREHAPSHIPPGGPPLASW